MVGDQFDMQPSGLTYVTGPRCFVSPGSTVSPMPPMLTSIHSIGNPPQSHMSIGVMSLGPPSLLQHYATTCGSLAVLWSFLRRGGVLACAGTRRPTRRDDTKRRLQHVPSAGAGLKHWIPGQPRALRFPAGHCNPGVPLYRRNSRRGSRSKACIMLC